MNHVQVLCDNKGIASEKKILKKGFCDPASGKVSNIAAKVEITNDSGSKNQNLDEITTKLNEFAITSTPLAAGKRKHAPHAWLNDCRTKRKKILEKAKLGVEIIDEVQ